jgi:hypothetical protein
VFGLTLSGTVTGLSSDNCSESLLPSMSLVVAVISIDHRDINLLPPLLTVPYVNENSQPSATSEASRTIPMQSTSVLPGNNCCTDSNVNFHNLIDSILNERELSHLLRWVLLVILQFLLPDGHNRCLIELMIDYHY